MSKGFSAVKAFFGFGPTMTDNVSGSYCSDDYTADHAYVDDRMIQREPVMARSSYGSLDARPVSRDARYDAPDSYPASYEAAHSRSGSSHASYVSDPMARSRSARCDTSPTYTSMILDDYKRAGELAHFLKADEVVVFSLPGMQRDEARRVLDFAAGLCRGVDARIEKLPGVRQYALIPKGIVLDNDQLAALAEQL